MKYLIMPLRMPVTGKIFSWLLFCPDGMIHSEDTFADAIARMDMNANKAEAA